MKNVITPSPTHTCNIDTVTNDTIKIEMSREVSGVFDPNVFRASIDQDLFMSCDEVHESRQANEEDDNEMARHVEDMFAGMEENDSDDEREEAAPHYDEQLRSLLTELWASEVVVHGEDPVLEPCTVSMKRQFRRTRFAVPNVDKEPTKVS